MTAAQQASIHATAVLVGASALLIRGPAGSGKSSLALRLIEAAETGGIRFARLVGDDRVYIESRNGVLLARPADALAGLIEVRGFGLQHVPFEPVAAVGGVVDLAATDAERFPAAGALATVLAGVRLPRLAVALDADPIRPVLAFLQYLGGSPPRAPIPI